MEQSVPNWYQKLHQHFVIKYEIYLNQNARNYMKCVCSIVIVNFFLVIFISFLTIKSIFKMSVLGRICRQILHSHSSQYNPAVIRSFSVYAGAPAAASGTKNGNPPYERIPRESKDDDIVTNEILRASLNYVNSKGWNDDAIRAGAEDIFQSGEIGSIFRDFDLVRFFITSSNQELETHLSQNKVGIKDALEFRLRKVVPYVPRFHEALAITTRPENVSESMRLLLHLADSIAHHSMGDKSTDINWYTKRLGIASIYVASELCLVQDKSDNYTETFEFLDRRVNDFQNLGNGQISSSIPLPDIMAAGFTTAMNILGRNARR